MRHVPGDGAGGYREGSDASREGSSAGRDVRNAVGEGAGAGRDARSESREGAKAGRDVQSAAREGASAGRAGPAPVTVRPVREADVPRVWEMIRGLAGFEGTTDTLTGSEEKLRALLFDPPPAFFGRVAERPDGRLVGYALYYFTYSSFRTNPRMYLEDLYVEDTARGTGAGEALLRAFAADALARGCHRVDWHVLKWNPARGFYEAMGAHRSDDGMLQYGLDAAEMQRLVAAAGSRAGSGVARENAIAGRAGASRVAVRPMREADLPRVWEMIRGLAEFERMTPILTGSLERLREFLFREPPALFGRVAERADGRLVGYALHHFTYSSPRTSAGMWLEDLYVEDAARGTGAGAALLRAFVADARAHGCHRVDWGVLEWNPARAFYEAMGARRTDDGIVQYGLDAAGMRRLVDRP